VAHGPESGSDRNGQHMLRASSPSEFLITLPQPLPPDVTVEVDLIPKRCCNPEDFMLVARRTLPPLPGSPYRQLQAELYVERMEVYP
jgi:hypothetical protein